MSPFLKPKRVRQITENIVLMLMLWAAPVPVGHCHSDCGSRVSSQQMTMHLQLYHGGAENANNWPSRWHLHWVFQPSGQLAIGDDLAIAHDAPMVSSRVDDLFDTVGLSQLDSRLHQQLYVQLVIPDECQNSFQTVALLLSRRSLPELLGIMRC